MTARKVFFLEPKDNCEKDTIPWLVVVTVCVVIADKIRNGHATVRTVPSIENAGQVSEAGVTTNSLLSTELTRWVHFHQTQPSRTEKTKIIILTVLPKAAASPILLLTIPLDKLTVFNQQVTLWEQGYCPRWLSTVFIAHDPRTRVPSNDHKITTILCFEPLPQTHHQTYHPIHHRNTQPESL